MPGGHLGAIRAKLAEASWRLDDRSRNVGLYGPLPALSRRARAPPGFPLHRLHSGLGNRLRSGHAFPYARAFQYLILNLLLFVALFLFGYLTQAIPGVTFSMQMLAI